MRIVTSFLIIAFLSGCSFLKNDPLPTPEPVIKIKTEYKTLDIYQPPLPKKIDLQDVEFFVVTEKNLEEQIARISKMQDATFVIFGMTPQDYENMAFNLQELRRYIRQQKEIIIYYRNATQEDWLDRNEQEIEEQQ
jgi:hypothetical protein|tara:strand:+ start:299 stop:706 length:408 start_codon:yes stop_codon:yes gene_type:complete